MSVYGSRREGQAGKPDTMWLSFFWDYGHQRGAKPNPKKFENIWNDGEETPNDFDKTVLSLRMKGEDPECLEWQGDETQLRHRKKYPNWSIDNVYWRHYCVNSAQGIHHQRSRKPITQDNYNIAYAFQCDQQRAMNWLRNQLDHCIGNLGEDHPTCKKARWHYETRCERTFMNFFNEMDDIGWFDAQKRWGLKMRASLLPVYQPVKENIPGSYEHRHYQKVQENGNLTDNFTCTSKYGIMYPQQLAYVGDG